jgi:hypothetical protein
LALHTQWYKKNNEEVLRLKSFTPGHITELSDKDIDMSEAECKTPIVLSLQSLKLEHFFSHIIVLLISAIKPGMFISGARKSPIFMGKLSSTHLTS